jgi:hypothetical protein
MPDDTSPVNPPYTDFARLFRNAVAAIDMSKPSATKNKPVEAFLRETLGWEPVAAKSVPSTNATDNRLSEALRKQPTPRFGLVITKANILETVVQTSKKFVGQPNNFRVLLFAIQDGQGGVQLTDIIASADDIPQVVIKAFPDARVRLVEGGIGEPTRRQLVLPVGPPGQDVIRSGLVRILTNYPSARREPLKEHPLAAFIRKTWPEALWNLLDRAELSAEIEFGGAKFIGSWAAIAWVGFRHTALAPSFMEGVYCVYLFAEDGSRAVLGLGQGVLKGQNLVPADVLTRLFAAYPPPDRFTLGQLDPSVLASSGDAARSYARATLAHIVYEKEHLPDEANLQADFLDLIDYLHAIAKSNELVRLLNPTVAGSASSTVIAAEVPMQTEFSLDDCAAETGFPAHNLKDWLDRLDRKKQLVLQGPPGTGKTFLAQRLARVIVSKTHGRVELVQFHPSYSYEDFVQGIRPTIVDGILTYSLKPGRFIEFCEAAASRPDDRFVLIIDEMNRGNLSRIFGELLFLLEYRDQVVPLAQGSEPFSVPSNLFVIGTMNTADRSIALVDHALRRRFSFVFLAPDYDLLARRLREYGLEPSGLVATLNQVNQAIGDRNYHLGTSFFLSAGNAIQSRVKEIWEGEIEPYLEEYFFDQQSKVEPFRWRRVEPIMTAAWTQQIASPHPNLSR